MLMSTMTASLQKHHNDLQNYLSEWSKRQQQMIDLMENSTTTISQTCIGRQELADEMKTMHVSNIMAPALVSECTTAVSAEGQTPDRPSNRNGSNTQDNSSLTSDLEHAGLLSSAGNERAPSPERAPCEADEAGLTPVERCRSELVRQLQVSLNTLQSLMYPGKEQITSWLTTTLDMLDGEFSKLDLVESAEERDKSVPILCESSVVYNKQGQGIFRRFQHEIAKVVRNGKFESLSAIVILLNAIVMGISTDYQIEHLEPESSFWKDIEIAFLSYYSFELFLRVFHHGKRFFCGQDLTWNWFDITLVLLSAAELWPESGASSMNVSFLRLFRLLKMAKLLRMFRLMKMFSSLRLILASIFGSMCAICWAGVLVVLVCYMASLLFLNLVTSFLLDARTQNLDVNTDVILDIEKYWGSVSTGMNSLFGATSGGEDWFTIAAPLREVGNGCYFFFILYMGFFLIVILNTFSSLFVQSVLENQEKDSAAIIEAEMEKKDMYIAQLQEFFDHIDDDSDGAVSHDEFVKHADDPRLHAWAAYLGIDLTDARHFFSVLSNNGAVTVDIDSFVVGCIKLKGSAKSIDVMSVFQMTKQLQKRIEECYLLMHARNRQDASSKKTFEEIADIMHARNPLPILSQICSNQEKIMGQASLLLSLQAKKSSSSVQSAAAQRGTAQRDMQRDGQTVVTI